MMFTPADAARTRAQAQRAFDSTPAGLLAYSASARWNKVTAGITVDGIAMPTDPQTTANLTGAVVMAGQDPAFTAQWKIADGTFVTLNATQIVAIGVAVASYIQTCFATEATLAAGIKATPPTVTTRAQIDAAYEV